MAPGTARGAAHLLGRQCEQRGRREDLGVGLEADREEWREPRPGGRASYVARHSGASQVVGEAT